MAGKANPRFEQALTFAVNAHVTVHQERKGTDFPYAIHPIRVAAILDQFGCADDVIVAGFLHDTIEDADVTEAKVIKEFDQRVASLVTAASEPDKSLSWRERKEHTLAQLGQEDDPGVLALATADKLDNVRSIAETLSLRGHAETWAIFNAGEADQRWYYRELADVLLAKNPENSLFRALHDEAQRLFP